ncbi:UNKNOWN [Stylonychia lemnae]|uniref:C2 NT-type domain-containing protein n=1 Tax=Stylonychia lemnae TaxID=5949 RepID=A0A078ABS6_STYLE|nr:UNKNOWN [Stylonychia lemnae]|eukprot:CDW79311.1 UNKNOWN [Stylonychia lemnae]
MTKFLKRLGTKKQKYLISMQIVSIEIPADEMIQRMTLEWRRGKKKFETKNYFQISPERQKVEINEIFSKVSMFYLHQKTNKHEKKDCSLKLKGFTASSGFKEKVIGVIKFELSDYVGMIREDKSFDILKCSIPNSTANIKITVSLDYGEELQKLRQLSIKSHVIDGSSSDEEGIFKNKTLGNLESELSMQQAAQDELFTKYQVEGGNENGHFSNKGYETSVLTDSRIKQQKLNKETLRLLEQSNEQLNIQKSSIVNSLTLEEKINFIIQRQIEQDEQNQRILNTLNSNMLILQEQNQKLLKDNDELMKNVSNNQNNIAKHEDIIQEQQQIITDLKKELKEKELINNVQSLDQHVPSNSQLSRGQTLTEQQLVDIQSQFNELKVLIIQNSNRDSISHQTDLYKLDDF